MPTFKLKSSVYRERFYAAGEEIELDKEEAEQLAEVIENPPKRTLSKDEAIVRASQLARPEPWNMDHTVDAETARLRRMRRLSRSEFPGSSIQQPTAATFPDKDGWNPDDRPDLTRMETTPIRQNVPIATLEQIEKNLREGQDIPEPVKAPAAPVLMPGVVHVPIPTHEQREHNLRPDVSDEDLRDHFEEAREAEAENKGKEDTTVDVVSVTTAEVVTEPTKPAVVTPAPNAPPPAKPSGPVKSAPTKTSK